MPGNGKKKKSRPNQIDPSSLKKDVEKGDVAVHESRKDITGTFGLYAAAKLTVKSAVAKRVVGKWKSYVTTKRRVDRRKAMMKRNSNTGYVDTVDGVSSANDNGSSSAKNGQGLDDIHNNDCKAASNRALLQYFAKLGQSLRSDDVLDLDFVESLIKQGARMNCKDICGQTILHEVARTWHIDVAKFVIEHLVDKGDINMADDFGRTPLHVAAAVDYPDMCEFLISQGADKEARTKGENQTPLFYAARNDATLALAMLIKCECEYKYVRDYKGRTPIYVAAELDRSETARYLLEHHAPVGVTDNSGQPALTWMINKMAPVAKEALDQLHTCDRANRKQYFHLHHLEPTQPGETREGYAQMPLQVLVQKNNFDLVLHPVIMEQIRVKWDHYGKLGALRQLALQVIFITLWTIIALHSGWYHKCLYVMPQDIWKIVIYVVAVGFTIYQIVDELREFYTSQREHKHWKEWRIKQIEEDISYCHPRWPEEKSFLENEMEDLDKFKSNYFQDFWNIFDWICYAFLLASTITHVIDVIDPSIPIARLHNRVMSLNILMVWLRTMKYLRCFTALGPFIVMLGEMIGDMAKFAFLYVIFLIPFSVAFWMVFGGTVSYNKSFNDTCAEMNLNSTNSPRFTQTIKGMAVPDEMLFTMYRLTLVDEYELDAMLDKDKPMTYILLGMWFWISAILCLNLFIALLSDTFQRVYDNARANAIMQKALTVLMIEDKLMEKTEKNYRKYIKEKCSPEVVYYDDDTGEGGDELKKVTIQTKEKVQELMEVWTLKFGAPSIDEMGEKYYHLDGHHSDNNKDDDDGDDDNRGGRRKPVASTKDSVTENKLENEIDILRAELTQVEKKRREFEKNCLTELSALKSLLTSSAAAAGGNPTRPSSTLNPLPDYGNLQMHMSAAPLTDGSLSRHPSTLNPLPDYGNLRIDTFAAPPTYPAAIAERVTPRVDQLSPGASASHVDISTVPRSGRSTDPPNVFTPAVRVDVLPEPRIAFIDPGESPDV